MKKRRFRIIREMVEEVMANFGCDHCEACRLLRKHYRKRGKPMRWAEDPSVGKNAKLF